MKKTFIPVLLLSVVLSVFLCAGGFVSSTIAGMEKRMFCEERCLDSFWRCRQRAYNKNENIQERSLAICDTIFQGCMRRCESYDNDKK